MRGRLGFILLFYFFQNIVWGLSNYTELPNLDTGEGVFFGGEGGKRAGMLGSERMGNGEQESGN